MKLLFFTYSLLFLLLQLCCNNNRKEANPTGKEALFNIRTNRYILIDTTVCKTNYKVIYDSVSKGLYFIYGSRFLKLKTKNLSINKLNIEYLKFVKYYFTIPIIDSTVTFNNSNLFKLFFNNNYIIFTVTSDYTYFQAFVLFVENNKINKYFVLPDNHSHAVEFNEKNHSFMNLIYFDKKNDVLVCEDKLSFTDGPYLISIYKIKNDSIIKIKERLHNNENYSYFKKKDSTNLYIFYYMLQDNAEKMLNDTSFDFK